MGVEANPAFDAFNTYTAEIMRRAIYDVILARTSAVGSVFGGVIMGGDLALTAPASGMSVNTAVGEAMVPGSSSSTQSVYYLRVSAQTNISIAASNPSNPRIDLVCATINDQTYSGSTNNGVIQVVTGTPTSGATLANPSGAPALPASSLFLGYVLVPANASNIITSDILSEPSSALFGPHVLTVSGQAVTIPLNYESVKVVNNAASSVTITLTTAGATDSQPLVVRYYDFTGAVQTLTWSGVEAGATTAPTTSKGSITIPTNAGFIFNGATSLWACMAQG